MPHPVELNLADIMWRLIICHVPESLTETQTAPHILKVDINNPSATSRRPAGAGPACHLHYTQRVSPSFMLLTDRSRIQILRYSTGLLWP